jgi:hypothetical protein
MVGFVVYFNSSFDRKCIYGSNVCILPLECMVGFTTCMHG